MKFILALLSIGSIFCISSKPANALTTILYDGSGAPEFDSPPWLAPGAINSSGGIAALSGTSVTGGFQIDSNASGEEYSGYSNYNPFTSGFVNSSFPTLDNNSGYSIFFNVALDTTNDFSDTSDDRAAFSITAIGSGNQGIEIGFDEDRIFAQEDNFMRAETQNFGNIITSTDYQLTVLGNNYELLADTGSGFSSVISGSLRTYNFDPLASDPPLGTFNPYEIPGFLFFGDNTGQAHGTFTLGEISISTTSVPFEFSPNFGLALLGLSLGVKKLFTLRSK